MNKYNRIKLTSLLLFASGIIILFLGLLVAYIQDNGLGDTMNTRDICFLVSGSIVSTIGLITYLAVEDRANNDIDDHPVINIVICDNSD